MYLNKIMLIGYVGADPEQRYTPNDVAVTSIPLGVSDPKGETGWYKIVFYNKLGETIAQYVKKGMPLYVEGKLVVKNYKDKNGVYKTNVHVIGNNMQFLGNKEKQANEPPKQSNYKAPVQQELPSENDFIDDEIPF